MMWSGEMRGDDDEVELVGVEAAVLEAASGGRPRARSLAAWSSRAMRRSRMPVRDEIHSSEVSRNWRSPSLVSTRSGT